MSVIFSREPQVLQIQKDDNQVGNVEVFHDTNCINLTWDARIAAIRWDLIPWALTLDLDLPVSEAADAAMKRVWIIFDGVVDVTIPLVTSAVPNGIYLTSALSRQQESEKIILFSCDAMLAHKSSPKELTARSVIQIRAMAMRGVVSERSEKPNEFGVLDYAAKNLLASDAEMFEALAR
jgi:hypothetical protein